MFVLPDVLAEAQAVCWGSFLSRRIECERSMHSWDDVASNAFAAIFRDAEQGLMNHSRVPGAMQRSSRCFAEPGPYRTPAFCTAPALQRTTSRRAARCAASGARNKSKRDQVKLVRMDHNRDASNEDRCP